MESILENFSVYYALSIAVTAGFLLLTCFWERMFLPPLPMLEIRSNVCCDENYDNQLTHKKALLLAMKIKNNLPEDLKAMEKKVQQEQLEAIFALMKEQEQRFGINNMEEMEDQLKLYGY